MAPLLSGSIRKQRLAMVAPYLKGDVLEVGCNIGSMLHAAGGDLGRYVGIDINEDALARAAATFPEHQFLRRDIECEAFGFREEFDVVLMVALIEHVFNQGHLLDQCRLALRPGGSIVLTTPTVLGNDVVHRIGQSLGLFHKAVGDDHIVIYNKTRLLAAAAKKGFELSHYQRFQLGCNQLAVLRKPG